MVKRISKTCLTSVLTVLLLPLQTAYSQGLTVESMKALIEAEAGFGPEDFEAVDAGDVAVRRIKVKDRSEMAVCGLIRLPLPFDVVLEGFRRTINQQKKETAKDYGRISSPPSPNDLSDLEFDEGDLETLKNCRVGNCSWHLPEDVIRRIQSEIDWRDPDRQKKLSALLKSMIISYIKDYLERGNEGLIEYYDKPQVVRLNDEYAKLRGSLFWSEAFAPEFVQYYDDYPAGELKGVKNTVSWVKIKVGLKPVVIFSHNTDYQKQSNGTSQAFIVSKQIYANHYFDSTLGVSIVVGFPRTDGKDETYVLFRNYSRSRALGGRIGKLVQGLVAGQAVDRVHEVLAETKTNSALVMANRSAGVQEAEESAFVRIVKDPNFFWVLLALIVTGSVLVFIRWRARNP